MALQSPLEVLKRIRSVKCAVSLGGILCVWVACQEDPPQSLVVDAGFYDGGQALAASRCQARALAAGLLHTCAVTLDGAVFCWGDNQYGQLGVATPRFAPTPVRVPDLPAPAIALSLHRYASCARLADASVYCWGKSPETPLNAPIITKPMAVALPGNVNQIAVGGEHTCALLTDDRVFCWGQAGRNGDGSIIPRASPVQVMGLAKNLKSIAAADAHTCALTLGGDVFCWGHNPDNRLALTEPLVDLLAAVPVPALGGENVVLDAGQTSTCTINAAGQTVCVPGGGPAPIAVLGTDNVAVAVGRNHACLRKRFATKKEMQAQQEAGMDPDEGGGVFCWGSNESGQVGPDAPPVVEAGDARRVPLPSRNVTGIAAGDGHSCALLADRQLWCWGRNSEGQVGQGDLQNPKPPAPVAFAANACP